GGPGEEGARLGVLGRSSWRRTGGGHAIAAGHPSQCVGGALNVTCVECQSVFRVDPEKVPPGGVRARCSVCGAVIRVAHESPVARRSSQGVAVGTAVANAGGGVSSVQGGGGTLPTDRCRRRGVTVR